MDSEFYLQSRREWDERYGDLVLDKRRLAESRRFRRRRLAASFDFDSLTARLYKHWQAGGVRDTH